MTAWASDSEATEWAAPCRRRPWTRSTDSRRTATDRPVAAVVADDDGDDDEDDDDEVDDDGDAVQDDVDGFRCRSSQAVSRNRVSSETHRDDSGC